jgi:branched-chain amino acid aminotransferase
MGVWLGRDDNGPLGHGATGGGSAVPIWTEAMSSVIAQRRPAAFAAAPEGIVSAVIDTATGIRCATVATRRTSDLAIPARAKVAGNYVNSAFSKSEAGLNGFDEAIVLTEAGKVSEGSAENLFMVRGGKLITPGVNDDILEGITRAGIIEIAAELGIAVAERQIDRSELYIADEIFLVGTGAQVSPVIEVDHRSIGTGAIGEITKRIQSRYFDAVRGKVPGYKHWLTPIY